MSSRELKRLGVMARVEKEALNLVNAAEIRGLSYRQAKGIWRLYQQEGAEGLQHRSVGRESGRSKPKKFRLKVLRLVRRKYSGEVGERFGPTLAAEHLGSEDGMEVHPETLRRWMLAEGLWSRMRKRRAHRKRREPREHFGELVQMDGSFHEWYEQRGPKGCLMNLVDDATATTLAVMGVEETIWTAARVLRSLETFKRLPALGGINPLIGLPRRQGQEMLFHADDRVDTAAEEIRQGGNRSRSADSLLHHGGEDFVLALRQVQQHALRGDEVRNALDGHFGDRRARNVAGLRQPPLKGTDGVGVLPHHQIHQDPLRGEEALRSLLQPTRQHGYGGRLARLCGFLWHENYSFLLQCSMTPLI